MDVLFWDAIQNRRSIYGLGDEKTVPTERVEEIVRDAIKNTPSAFNSQSTRILLLFDDESRKFWRCTLESIRSVTNDAQYAASEQKINGSFAGGYGTVLFFEDQTTVEKMQSSFPFYAGKFPVWSQHTNAMHQIIIWSAFESEGLGASLQHYNPIVDEAVHREWLVPENWILVAQMPFGKPLGVPGAKEFSDVEARIKVFK